MCNYSDFVEQQGLKKGREEGHLESLSESVANLVRDIFPLKHRWTF